MMPSERPIRAARSRPKTVMLVPARARTPWFRRRCRSSIVLHQFDTFAFEVGDAAIGDVLDVFDSGPLQERGGKRAPDPAGARDGQRLLDVPDLLGHAISQRPVGHEDRTLNVPRFPLAFFAHVDERNLPVLQTLG